MHDGSNVCEAVVWCAKSAVSLTAKELPSSCRVTSELAYITSAAAMTEMWSSMQRHRVHFA